MLERERERKREGGPLALPMNTEQELILQNRKTCFRRSLYRGQSSCFDSQYIYIYILRLKTSRYLTSAILMFTKYFCLSKMTFCCRFVVMMSSNALTLLAIFCMVGCSVAVESESIETNEIPHYYQQRSINSLFDLFLKRYAEELVKTGRTQVQIPGFQESFSSKIFSVIVEGGVVVDDGWCSNISSVHRTGDADMERVHTTAVLTAHLGLQEFKINYNNYDVSLLGVHQNGNIRVDVGENSVWLKLNAQLIPKCNITLTDMRIEQLNDINVDISNLGIFEHMTDDITSWVVSEVTKWYRGYVEQTVFPELADIVKKADLCHYLHI